MAKSNVIDLTTPTTGALSLEELRSRLRPADALDKILEVSGILQDQWEMLGKNQIDALKAQAELNFRLLAKTIPDMKSIDQSAGSAPAKVNFFLNLDGNQTKKL
jgi:hypothetical protein